MTAPHCAVLRCPNLATTAFQYRKHERIREWAVCEWHSHRLDEGEIWAFDGRVILLEGDLPRTVQKLTIHTAGESEFTVTLEHGYTPDELESITLRLPLWARRLLHASLSSRLDEDTD